jgi:hypothetical protein
VTLIESELDRYASHFPERAEDAERVKASMNE